MIKYNSNYTSSIIVAIIFIVIISGQIVFGSEDKPFEVSPYMDFNGTIHGGGGDFYEGFGFGIGAGMEALFVVNDGFAFGINGVMRLNYDNYIKYLSDENTLIDDYGLWTGTGGVIVYIGDWFYTSYMAIINMRTFHKDSYLATKDGDIAVEKIKYKIDKIDYCLELGIRASYHISFYIDLTTHLVESDLVKSKYQVYMGVKYHI